MVCSNSSPDSTPASNATTKGASRLLSYLFAIFLGIFVIVAVVSLLYNFYASTLDSEIHEDLNQLTLQLSGQVVRLYEVYQYSQSNPSNYSSALIGQVDLNLPTDISSRSYRIYFVSASPLWSTVTNLSTSGQNISAVEENPGAKIVAETTQDPIIRVERAMPNLDVALQGMTFNGQHDNLYYYRHNIDNALYDTIILGNNTMLITVDTVN